MILPIIQFDKDYASNLEDLRVFLNETLKLNVDDAELPVLLQAFTTPGYHTDHPVHKDYERLEFLGDAVIKAYISRSIFEKYPEMDEGRMSKICQYLWNDKTYPMCIIDSGISFLDVLLLPSSEANQPLSHKVDFITSVVSDCFEALIGALKILGQSSVTKCLLDKLLLYDVDQIMETLKDVSLRYWDNNLNDVASKKVSEFKQFLAELLIPPYGGV